MKRDGKSSSFGGAATNWNDERVALLKKLWAEGLSGDQIAGRIGGVTRNAVIGKVHRLGLQVRATTVRKKTVSRKYAGPVAAKPAAPKPIKPIQWKNPFIPGGPVGAERKPVEPYREPPAPRVFDPLKMVRTVDLEDHHCRWPVGDPLQDSFRHCGEDRVLGLRAPYCERCARVAFKSPEIVNATGVPSAVGGDSRPDPSPVTPETVEAAHGRKLEDA